MEMGLDIAYVQGDCPTFIIYSVPTKYKWTRLLGHTVELTFISEDCNSVA